MGIGFFPITDPNGSAPFYCTAQAYSSASVPIHWAFRETMFTDALAAQRVGDETWTRPALEGALSYASFWKAIPHSVDAPGALMPPTVVLMTGASPTGCGGTVDNLVAAAAASFRASPHIRTAVVAVGPEAKALEPVAIAGGTHRAYASPPLDMDEVLARVARTRVICDIPVGEPYGRPDVTRLQVKTRSTSAEPLAAIAQVADWDSCAQGGWFLDRAATPPIIMLCPSTCATLVDAPAGQVVAGVTCDQGSAPR
jgi:hypothetical protein